MQTVMLDGRHIETKQQLHACLKKQLNLPDYYGENLDALYDCLGDITQPIVIRIAHREALEENLGEYAKKLAEVLVLAAKQNGHLHVVLEDEKAK